MMRLLTLGLVAVTACSANNGRGTNVTDDGGVVVTPMPDAAVVTVGQTTQTVIAPGAPADAPQQFSGAADPALAPTVAYPPDGVLVPPNLNELEVQFTPTQAGGSTLFEVAFRSSTLDLRIYTKCNVAGSGCSLLPDEKTWKLLSQASAGSTVMLTVRATAGGGAGVGSSAPRKLSFADEEMQGGLYYWAASTGGIFRYDFGLRGQKAESFYTPTQAGGAMCVGCHALARNGKRIAVGLNAPTPSAQMRLLDVATRKPIVDVGGMFGGGSNFEALTADASRLITTEGGGLTMRDAATGAVMGATPAVANADMPDVSPDGTSVVFARGAGGCQFGFCQTLSVMNAGLFSVPLTVGGFGAQTTTLVSPGGGNNYYPSYSPDGKLVVYNHAAGDSYDAKDARVRVVLAGGGGHPQVDLGVVNQEPGNSWPKWAPFVHHFQGRTIYWITFTSRRLYGLKGDGMNPQVWMAALDGQQLTSGSDGSFPAFWLPFQDFATGNHIAQWVEKVERAPCSQVDQSGCMMGEMCVNGVCEPGIM